MRTVVARERVISVEPGAFRKANLTRRALLVGFLMPLALNAEKFGDDNGIAWQVLLLAATLSYDALYLMLEWLSPPRYSYKSSLHTATVAWWVYIALSPLPVPLSNSCKAHSEEAGL